MSASGGSGGAPPELPPEHPFPDRRVAAVALAARLDRFRGEAPIVIGLEPGGVPVGEVVAEELGAPFAEIAVARVGAPGRRVGAVAEDGPTIIDHDLACALGLDGAGLARARQAAEAAVAEVASI